MEKMVCRGGDGTGHEAHWREGRTCSYCGSMHPDDFLQAMKDALDPESPTYIDQTTKYYKRYVVDNESQKKFYLWHIPSDDWADQANAIDKHVRKFSTTKMDRRINSAMGHLSTEPK